MISSLRNKLTPYFTEAYRLTTPVREVTCIPGVLLGMGFGYSEAKEEYTNYTNHPSISKRLALAAPEIITGGICGYFWMYTLLPYSFYKRYQIDRGN